MSYTCYLCWEVFSCLIVVLYFYDFYQPTCFCLIIISLATTNKHLHLNCKLMCIKRTYFHTQHAHHLGEASYPSEVKFFRLSSKSEPLYGLVGERKRIRRGRIALKVIWLLGKDWDRNVAVLFKISSVILEVQVTEMKFLSIFFGFYSSRLILQMFHISFPTLFNIFRILP